MTNAGQRGSVGGRASSQLLEPSRDITGMVDWFQAAIDHGLYDFADAGIRSLEQELGEQRPDLLLLRADIARRVGEAALARGRATAAVHLNPSVSDRAKRLVALCGNDDPVDEQAQGPRHMLIRAWGAGFWSDVDHVLGSLLLAEVTRRVPTVWWGQPSRYRREGRDNAWLDFFEPVSGAQMEEIQDLFPVHPPKWSPANVLGPPIETFRGRHARIGPLQLLNRSEPLVVADFYVSAETVLDYARPSHADYGGTAKSVRRRLVSRYLRPVPAVVASVDELAGRFLGRGPVLAVHVRTTDKCEEDASLPQRNTSLPELAQEFLARQPDSKVFLMTDARSVIDRWKSGFGDRVVHIGSTVSTTETPVHFQNRPDGSILGREILIETLLAARCDRFIGPASSNIGQMVNALKDWPNGSIMLFGKSLQATPNWEIFDPRRNYDHIAK